jgi:hypothetical protein
MVAFHAATSRGFEASCGQLPLPADAGEAELIGHRVGPFRDR